MLELIRMTPTSYARFLARAVPQYTAEKVRNGEWSSEEAAARGQGEFQMLLPQGPGTPENFLYDLHDDDSGQDVGVLWYALRGEGARASAFVYEIEVFAAHRRQGYATQAFAALELDATANGARSLQLHVFGHNRPARALYETLGFQPTNLILRKDL